MTECAGDHCVTCSDEGVRMVVLEPGADGLAVCADGEGGRVTVITDLVGPVAPGESMLVHAGVALVRLEDAA